MGTRAWRGTVAAAVAGSADIGDGALLAFHLPRGRWVDLDTLVEATLAGARDAGAVAPGLRGLDAVVATKTAGDQAGAELCAVSAVILRRRRAPGPQALAVSSDRLPRPNRADKLAWRSAIDESWAGRPPLDGAVWADVALRVRSSLLGRLEVVIDALEPVLGRDPRGRDWQEFFPNDHRITWLRVTRTARGPVVRLRLGPVAGRAAQGHSAGCSPSSLASLRAATWSRSHTPPNGGA